MTTVAMQDTQDATHMDSSAGDRLIIDSIAVELRNQQSSFVDNIQLLCGE